MKLKDAQRKLWALNGILEHQYNAKLLEKIFLTYERIDMVPTGYNHPELHPV